MMLVGRVSWFGGPPDLEAGGISADEGLAFIYKVSDQPRLFLPDAQPEPALAQDLNPELPYLACRWDYDDPEQTREMLLTHLALVRAPDTGRALLAIPADWGPGEQTGRVCDVSPSLLEALGIGTDDIVEVEFPFKLREKLEAIG